MHDYYLLEILAIGFALALLLGYFAVRLGLSPIVGYLLAGFLVGPQSPGFVADGDIAVQLAEAGVILLMFGVGLHFNMKDLLAVKGAAIPGAIAQCAVATFLGASAAYAFGFDLGAGLVLGLGLSVASTVVLLRVLSDNGVVDTVQGHVAVGWLIVEDIFTVIVLLLLPSLASIFLGDGVTGPKEIAFALGLALFRLSALWVVVLVVGGKIVPWLLTKVVRTRSQELFTLTILVAAFATAVLAAEFFNASMALGAFLGGMVVGKTKVSHQAGADLLPLRDAFAVLFFISVGMLFDPAFLLEQPGLIISCLAIVLLAKPLIAMVVVVLLGYSARTALTVATSLAQVGEFSFILAQAAFAVGLIPAEVNSVLVVCAIVSISINPGFFQTIPFWEKLMRKNEKVWKFFNYRADRKAKRDNEKKFNTKPQAHNVKNLAGEVAIVVGYGPAGRSVTVALESQGIIPVVIDLNVDTVNELIDLGKLAVYGDSSKKEVLEAAGIDKADYIVITLPYLDATSATATVASNLNPEIRIIARARFLEDGGIFKQIGVSSIVFEEEEVAKGLTSSLLADLEYCRNREDFLGDNLDNSNEKPKLSPELPSQTE